jgi:hypothetical protein
LFVVVHEAPLHRCTVTALLGFPHAIGGGLQYACNPPAKRK